MKKTTIREVAKLANVSEATVSRVMSDSPLISEKTKEKVKKVIKKLDYHPNYAAVLLSKSNSKIIVTVVESENKNPLQNDYFTEILSHISKYAYKRNYYILYLHIEKNNDNALEMLVKSKRIDGVIFLNLSSDNSDIELLNKWNIPFVIIGQSEKCTNCLWVDSDNFDVSYAITEKFIKEKYEKIAFLSGPSKLTVSNSRKEGYLKALKDNNMPINQKYILSCDFDEKSSYNIAKKLLEKEEVQVIVTTDDILAIGCIKAAKKLNKDIKVSGFNKSKLRSLMGYNFLTVDIQYEKLALNAVNLLIDNIENILRKDKFAIVKTKIIKGD